MVLIHCHNHLPFIVTACVATIKGKWFRTKTQTRSGFTTIGVVTDHQANFNGLIFFS